MADMIDQRALQRIPLFRHVAPTRLKQLCSAANERQCEKGAVLFRQGDPVDALWIVLKGWVHLLRQPEQGDPARAVVLLTVTPREVVVGVSAIDDGSYSATAVAATTCRLIRIPTGIFRAMLLHEPAFAYETLRLLVRRLRRIAQQYGTMAEPVSHRIIRTILRLQEQFGRTVPMTHRELAQMSWTTTESAIRVVRGLKARQLVTGSRGRLTITRPQGLAKLLHNPGSRNGT